MGLTGAKGDKGDKGDQGPAGAGSLRVLDSSDREVGMLWAPNSALMTLGGVWVQVPLSNATTTGFADCTNGCLRYLYEDDSCGGDAYLAASSETLIRDAALVDDQIVYPTGAVSEHLFKSQKYVHDVCSAIWPMTAEGATVGQVPAASLGLTMPFHLGH
jgi:hypothetical protein